MKALMRAVSVLFGVTVAILTPALGQGVDSRYNTPAGPNGVPPAFIAGTPLADGRPGQYFYNIGAYAFRHHDNAFAIQMYKVAASWAYKPAEYNLGVIYARGQGVAVDLPRALAWMKLAAERNNPEYLEAVALVEANLKPGDAGKASTILSELEPRYGDKSALQRAKGRWEQVQAGLTGSHTGHPIGPVNIGGPDGTRTFGSDGSIATRGLMSGDNPYSNPTVTVGTMTTAKPNNGRKSKAPKSNQPAPAASGRHAPPARTDATH
jgi:hypothetical protein